MQIFPSQKPMLSEHYGEALKLINDMSVRIRKHVRKTDFFSWIESDSFAVLSPESYQRMSFLETRITEIIVDVLSEEGIYDAGAFHPVCTYSPYPGQSDTAADLIADTKSKLIE